MAIFFNGTKASSRAEAKGKVIAFLNQKGGVGKTTMAFNTASALSKKGFKVLCIDMDPQANLSLLLGVDTSKEAQFTIFNLLINSIRELKALHVSAMVQESIVRGKDKTHKIDLLPSGQELSGFELSIAAVTCPRQLILKNLIEKNSLNEIYDYIIIDSPPTLGLLVINILCAANGVMVPFKPDEFSRKGLSHLYEVLSDIEEMGITELPKVLAHIPNLMDTRRKQEGADLEKISHELSMAAGPAKIVAPFYNRAPLVKSQAQKKSVFDYQSKEFSGLQEQFNELAHIISTWSEGGSNEHYQE